MDLACHLDEELDLLSQGDDGDILPDPLKSSPEATPGEG